MDNEDGNTVQDQSSAHTNADEMKAAAEEELRRMKSIGFMDLFNFDKLLFPKIARVLFLLSCVMIACFLVLGIVGGLVAIFTQGFVDGVGVMVGVVVASFFWFIMTRIWFELILVGFKLYEHVGDIRQLLLKKAE